MNKRAVTLVVSVLIILSIVLITDRLSAHSPYSSITGAATLPDYDSVDVDKTASSYTDGQSDTYTYLLPDGQTCDGDWSVTATAFTKFQLDVSGGDNTPQVANNGGTATVTFSGKTNQVSATVTCTAPANCPDGYTLTASRSCEAPPSCIEQWTCTEWYPCVINTQFRTCTDANECGTIVTKPAESQPCVPLSDGEDNDTPDGDADDGTDDDDAGTGASDTGDNDTIGAVILNDTVLNGTEDNTTNITEANTTVIKKEKSSKTTFWLIIGGSAAGGVLMLTLISGLLLRRKGGSVMRVIQLRRR